MNGLKMFSDIVEAVEELEIVERERNVSGAKIYRKFSGIENKAHFSFKELCVRFGHNKGAPVRFSEPTG